MFFFFPERKISTSKDGPNIFELDHIWKPPQTRRGVRVPVVTRARRQSALIIHIIPVISCRQVFDIMSYAPSPENQKARDFLRRVEKQIFTVVAAETDRRWAWLLPIMKIALRGDTSAKSKSGGDMVSASEDRDSGGAVFEAQMFDCAAGETRDEWVEFLRVPVQRAAFTGRRDLVERLAYAGAPLQPIMMEAVRGPRTIRLRHAASLSQVAQKRD